MLRLILCMILILSGTAHAGLVSSICSNFFNWRESIAAQNDLNRRVSTFTEPYRSLTVTSRSIDLADARVFSRLSVFEKISWLRASGIHVILFGEKRGFQREPDEENLTQADQEFMSAYVRESVSDNEITFGSYYFPSHHGFIDGKLMPRPFQGEALIMARRGPSLNSTLMHEYLHHLFISQKQSDTHDQLGEVPISDMNAMNKRIEQLQGELSVSRENFIRLGKKIEKTRNPNKMGKLAVKANESYDDLYVMQFELDINILEQIDTSVSEELLVNECFLRHPDLYGDIESIESELDRFMIEAKRLAEIYTSRDLKILMGNYNEFVQSLAKRNPKVLQALNKLNRKRDEIKKKIRSIAAFVKNKDSLFYALQIKIEELENI